MYKLTKNEINLSISDLSKASQTISGQRAHAFHIRLQKTYPISHENSFLIEELQNGIIYIPFSSYIESLTLSDPFDPRTKTTKR